MLLENLMQKVEGYLKETDVKPDAIIPILRAGMIPATYLAYRLHILRILPVQYKYFYEDGNLVLKKLLSLPSETKLPKKPTLLLVECNHCFGITAKTAAEDLKKQFPDSTLLYATDTMDYSYQEVVPADASFYGILTNECRGLPLEEAKKVGLDNRMNLFPWEDLEEEWTTVQGKQFEYTNREKVQSQGEKRVVIPNNPK